MRVETICDRLYFLTVGQILHLSLDIFKFVFTTVFLFTISHLPCDRTCVYMGLLFYILKDYILIHDF